MLKVLNASETIPRSLIDLITESLENITYPLSECGLTCQEGGKATYGLTDDEQKVVDLSKAIGCTLCFVAIIFLAVNQYVDQKKTGKKFRHKPLLQIVMLLYVAFVCCNIYL